MPIKKRNAIAVVLALYLSVSLVRCYTEHADEQQWSIGKLALPGDAVISHSFTMPVSGAIRIQLHSDENAEVMPGSRFEDSTCRSKKPRPAFDMIDRTTNPDAFERASNERIGYYSRQNSCRLFGRFGIVRLELKNTATNTLIQTSYSVNMYHVPAMPGKGTAVADFRRFDKGTELELNVTSILSDTLKNREPRQYSVVIEPIRLPCSIFVGKEGENPGGCEPDT